MTKERSKKSVHFTKAKRKYKGSGLGSYNVSVQVKYLPPIEEQDKKNLYLSNIDKKTIREDAFDIAREISMYDNEMDILKQRPNRFSYTSLLTRAFQSCCCRNDNNKQSKNKNKSKINQLSDEDFKCLIQYVAKSYAHTRGLEKHIIEYIIKENRARLRRNSIRTYINEYATIMANYGYLSSRAEASLIESYRRSSVPSQRFARLMGQVDEEAVALERQTEDQQQQQQEDVCKEQRLLESPRTVLETTNSLSSIFVCPKHLFHHQADDNKESIAV
eukprot:CAMPEP_0194138492 /NCGR_PEP_ID=MMETSP0152-20130528/8275_1 /TAXON_ID=1049557 /ORGANISM="Thalassiothrix antarctica, Strain L6-D1" /LENGTH=274 /DNA_ID=CAMNT_0038835953 /DNA_START=159 /DNA_END=980 /DNA_ORIENTATION=+